MAESGVIDKETEKGVDNQWVDQEIEENARTFDIEGSEPRDLFAEEQDSPEKTDFEKTLEENEELELVEEPKLDIKVKKRKKESPDPKDLAEQAPQEKPVEAKEENKTKDEEPEEKQPLAKRIVRGTVSAIETVKDPKSLLYAVASMPIGAASAAFYGVAAGAVEVASWPIKAVDAVVGAIDGAASFISGAFKAIDEGIKGFGQFMNELGDAFADAGFSTLGKLPKAFGAISQIPRVATYPASAVTGGISGVTGFVKEITGLGVEGMMDIKGKMNEYYDMSTDLAKGKLVKQYAGIVSNRVDQRLGVQAGKVEEKGYEIVPDDTPVTGKTLQAKKVEQEVDQKEVQGVDAPEAEKAVQATRKVEQEEKAVDKIVVEQQGPVPPELDPNNPKVQNSAGTQKDFDELANVLKGQRIEGLDLVSGGREVKGENLSANPTAAAKSNNKETVTSR